MNEFKEVIKRTPGFNDVNAWIASNGELVVSLSHKNTNDGDILIRIRTEDDVILVDEAISQYTGSNKDGPWEDSDCQLGRLNLGGSWDA